jgi:TLD
LVANIYRGSRDGWS